MGFVFMQGGFGTLDELFEVMTLVQTQRIPRFPVVLFSNKHWTGLIKWMKSNLEHSGFINQSDLDLFTVTNEP